MPDYAQMYQRLFQSQTKAIAILQEAQQDTEEMYLSSPDPEIRILRPEDADVDGPDEET